MIKLNEHPFPLIEVFSPEGNCIGNITSQEMLADLQLQICQAKAVGWTIRYNGQVIPIDSLGQLATWPVGMVDSFNKLYSQLHKARKDEKSNN
jgi:hypothetical protein